MKNIIGLILLLTACVFNSTFADTPKKNQFVKITSMEIIGSAHKGQVVDLRIRFESYVDAKAELTFRFPNKITLSDKISNEKYRKEKINLAKGQQYERFFRLKVEDIGASMVQVIISLEEEIENYNQ